MAIQSLETLREKLRGHDDATITFNSINRRRTAEQGLPRNLLAALRLLFQEAETPIPGDWTPEDIRISKQSLLMTLLAYLETDKAKLSPKDYADYKDTFIAVLGPPRPVESGYVPEREEETLPPIPPSAGRRTGARPGTSRARGNA